ncbi:MAG: site-specific DNA-methyltransferase [Thermodesulfobacteriota bacterium]
MGEADIDKQKMNRLIWGDNLLAMQALLAQGYEGKINLIYIDPPFDSKADYSHKMTIPTNPSPSGRGQGEGLEFTKEPSVIERLAYKDTWAGGTDSYLDMLYPRLQLMKRLLAEDGSIYVHLDWHVGHYVKVMMDEVFGKENFRNEIIINRGRRKSLQSQFEYMSGLGSEHDMILLYSKTTNAQYRHVKSQIRAKGEQWQSFWRGNVERPTMQYELLGFKPTHGQFLWAKERAERAVKNYQEFIKSGEADLVGYWKKTGRKLEFIAKFPGRAYPQYWIPPKDEGLIGDVWTDIQSYSYSSDYDTEKHEDLLSRVIEMASDPEALVADFFCGSGTALAVAEKLNRRWIGCELGKVGIQVTRARLVDQQAKPFLIENIGNYQREMIYLTGGRIYEMQHLILKLYGATPRDKLSGLGIRRAEDNVEELVYVGYPDRPVTAGKAEELALQAQKLDGRGYKRLIILGWDYEYNYHQALESRKKAIPPLPKGGRGDFVEVISRDIPPDIYDYLKKAKTEEDIEALSEKVTFYERPYLKMDEPGIRDLKDGKVEISLSIKRYVLMDIPISQTSKKGQEDYAALMKIAKDNFAVLIDYWAVDWNYDGFTFKSQWQAFRGNGKKAKTVATEAKEILEKKKRTIAVRVVDIFGNDAGATVDLQS